MYRMTIYTVSLNSIDRIAGTPVNNAQYNFDWGQFAGTKYKMSWVLVSDTVNITSYTSICAVNITLSQTNSYKTDTTNQGSLTQSIGFLIPHTLSATTFLTADNSTNNPVWVKNTPQNNVFTVSLLGSSTGVAWVDNVGGIPASYLMTLTFETVEDNTFV